MRSTETTASRTSPRRTSPRRTGPRLTALIALLLAALPWLLFSQYVSDDLFLYGYDAGQSHYARFKLIGEALRDEGGLPLWQTGSYGGSPFHANLENPTLSPPIVALAALFPPLLALNLCVLLHLSLATVGMFLLCLRLWRRLSDHSTTGLAGSALAGMLFGLNAFTRVDSFNLVIYGAAHALIPWIFLAADALLHGDPSRGASRNAARHRGLWTAALALLVAAQVHTGSHWVYAYTAVALALWWLVEGVLGGPGPRQAALRWFPLAGLLALLLIAPKLLPGLDWVATTNRAGPLDPADAKGLTLAGEGVFQWKTLVAQVGQRTSGGLPLLFLPFALLAWRRRTVALVLGLAALGLLIAAGLLHDVALSHLPPFDRIRGAFRGWTLANAFLALGAGLGACRLVTLLPRPADPRRRDRLALWLVPAALPALLATGRHQEAFETPSSFEHVLSLYPHWTEAAARAGRDWRVMSLDVQEAGTRNEQFITAALGVETLAGFFGYAYPEALARHAYSHGAPLDPALRLRRVGVLSVGYAVTSDSGALRPRRWENRLSDPYPGGIDGDRVVSIEGARPRAWLPPLSVAIVGDEDDEVLYTLFDAPGFRPDRVTLIAFDAESPPSEQERAACDAVVQVGPASGAEDAPPAALSVQLPLDAASRARLLEYAAQLGRLGAPGTPETPGTARFERLSSREVRVELDAALREAPAARVGPRWLVLSEAWSLYGGWNVRADSGRSCTLRTADGVASAVLIQPGESSLQARYDPASVRLGLQLGALGLLATLGLALAGWRRRPAG